MFDYGGPLSFGAAADLGLQVRERVKHKGDAIILDFSRIPFVDVSAARAVETIICDARHAGRIVYVTGMNDEVKNMLTGLNADHCLPANTRFSNRLDALRSAVDRVREARGEKPSSGDGALPTPAS